MNEAAMAALEERLTSIETTCDTLTIKRTIKRHHFEVALSKVSPSVSDRVWLILLYFFHIMPYCE